MTQKLMKIKHPKTGEVHEMTIDPKVQPAFGGGNHSIWAKDCVVISSEDYTPPEPTAEELVAREEAEKKHKEWLENRGKNVGKPATCSCEEELKEFKALFQDLAKKVEALEKAAENQKKVSDTRVQPPSPQPAPPTGKLGKPKVNVNTETDVVKIASLNNFGLGGASSVIKERESVRGKFKDEADLLSRMRIKKPLSFEGRLEF